MSSDGGGSGQKKKKRSRDAHDNVNMSTGIVPIFKIPARKEILCEEPPNDNQFYVKDRTNISCFTQEKIHQELESIGNKLCGGGSKCLEILNNNNFDFLFSVIYYLEDQNI